MNRAAPRNLILRLAAVSVLLPLTPAGCTQRSGDTSIAEDKSSPEAPVTVRVTGVEGYEETIAKLRGKVVLVDFWATWCLPCLEQFPQTVKMSREHGEQGLAVVSVSLNKPDEEPQVREFLTRQGATFDNLLSEYRNAVQAGEAFKLPGPVPCYRVYDREGKLHREFAINPRAERQFTHADVEAAVAELL